MANLVQSSLRDYFGKIFRYCDGQIHKNFCSQTFRYISNAVMSEKKRQRVHDHSEVRARKRASPERPPGPFKVLPIEPGDEWTPILGA